MLALIQRVNWTQLRIKGQLHAQIDRGILALIGIEKDDDEKAADRLLGRLLAYRIFADDEGKMNLDLKDVGGDLMLVSQFTLAASTSKGLRPSFSSAKPPGEAELLFDYLLKQAAAQHDFVASGVFQADMQIALENDGPVTFLLKG